jgi:hypothetical protein
MFTGGTADRVDLYGGHCFSDAGSSACQTASTDLVIVPSLAGKIAEALRPQCGLHPVDRAQYHAGAEVAGLCTRGVVHRRHGTGGRRALLARIGFVDAAFRKEFSYIGLIVDRNRTDERAISGTGAYSFFQRVLERVGGREDRLSLPPYLRKPPSTSNASPCWTSLTKWRVRRDARRRHPTPFVWKTAPRITKGVFASMFDGEPARAQRAASTPSSGEPGPRERCDIEAPHQTRVPPRQGSAAVSLNGSFRKWRAFMAKRKARVMSDKEDPETLHPVRGRAFRAPHNPTFIKAVVAVDPVMTGRKSAVIEIPGSKSKKRREQKACQKE